MMRPLLLATAIMAAAPAIAADAVTTQLTPAQREGYAAVFAGIRGGRYDEAAARLDGMGDGPLHAMARAQLYTARGSAKVDGAVLSDLLTRAPDLPQAPQIAALLRKRGGDLTIPTLPQPRNLTPVRGAPRRLNAKSSKADMAAAQLARDIKPFVKEDRAGEMEGYLLAAQEKLSPEARTEYQQKIAWAYFLGGDDENALRLSLTAGQGSGDFATQADWVAGLAAWRQDRCDPASKAFDEVARNARDDEMRAAGYFWAARADLACRRPEKVQAKLRTAARIPETFYGMLAARTLAIDPPAPVQRAGLAGREWSSLRPHSNAQAAAALVEIGETGLADQVLRWQARIGAPSDHLALTHLAASLDLPGTQVWLAHNSPDGNRVDASARYPAPGWTPANGWRVDRNLVFAHSLEESVFRTSAMSGAGAKGLMGIMPGTADQLDRREGLPTGDRSRLNDPAVNMAYGQRMLTWLSTLPSTGGLLPKVIAAYNAGPGSNIKWNPALRDRGDPLLWMESVPYNETRAYVGLVLRNYWMYQRQSGADTPSMTALAGGMWPRFPTQNGQSTALRVQAPARSPVRMAVVMPPVRAPKAVPLPDTDDEGVTMLADAAPAPARPLPTAAPAPAHALAASAPVAVRTPSAPARALASTVAAGKDSVTVVRRVVKTLAAPVAGVQATGLAAGGLDDMLAPILKKELPRVKAAVSAKASATIKAN